MPRHLISDADEWINEIPSVPIYFPQGSDSHLLEDLGRDDPTDPSWPHPGRDRKSTRLNSSH